MLILSDSFLILSETLALYKSFTYLLTYGLFGGLGDLGPIGPFLSRLLLIMWHGSINIYL